MTETLEPMYRHIRCIVVEARETLSPDYGLKTL